MSSRENVTIAPEWQELLRQRGLVSVDAVYQLREGTILKGGTATELRRVELRDEKQARVLYIKKYWYPTSKLRWSGFYRGTYFGTSKVRREYENLARLRAWGLDAPSPVAYGEERRGGWLHRSFLISEGVPAPLSLDLFIRDVLPTLSPSERRRKQEELTRALADYTRRMHEHRFVHHDYFWRNILLSEQSLRRFFLIDSHKGRPWKSWAELQARAKDLATLDSPAPWFFRRSERLRFFLVYRGHVRLTTADKELMRLVLRLAEPMRQGQMDRVSQAQPITGRARNTVSNRQKTPSLWKRFRYRLEALILEFLAATVPLLSRKMLVRVANAAGWLAFHVAANERRIALTNLDIAFGSTKSPEEKRGIARSAFQNFARSFLGLFWAKRLTPETLDKIVEIDPDILRMVQAAQARGKGIIFVTYHFGEWETLGVATALFGFPLMIVMEQLRNPHLTRIFERLRGHGVNQIILQRHAMTKLLKTLKRGEAVALLIDLNAVPSRGGIWLDFFGKPVFGFSGAAALARHTGAALIPAASHPLPDGRIRAVYGPEIPCANTGDEEADLQVTSQQCLRFCEDLIRREPERWLWFYRRWKFRPNAEQRDFPYYSRWIEEVRPARAQNTDATQSPNVPEQSGP
ncbi:MAG: lipopolysaccharide kinase InaA family protein [Verrucomicrobiia bacterium]|jgi:lauroyl/myristoyl acyltransferase/tRNA A-37 threonylcarbamoyl transferase component Bud32